MDRNFRFAFIALTSLFFIWGFITVVVDAFIPRLKEVFELTYGQAGLVQVAWFLAYLVLSIPGGIILSRIGYKKGIITGLFVAGLGCILFYPAAAFREFNLFLLALFVLAGGLTFLQVSANPFVSVLGDESGAASRLNLSQAFNSLGTTLAPIFSATFLLSDSILTSSDIAELSDEARMSYLSSEASAVQLPFILIGLVLIALALVFFFLKLPRILDDYNKSSFFDALKHKNLRLGIIAIFLYVGAEVAIGSYLTNYFLSLDLQTTIKESVFLSGVSAAISATFSGKAFTSLDDKAVVGGFLIFYWGGAMIGRFIGSYLTRVMKTGAVLTTFSILAITMLLITISSSGIFAMVSALSVGLFNSIMFPTIFTMSIDGLGDSKPQASGLLCTAIFGGAIIPPLFGTIVDAYGFNTAFLLPILCYGFIWFFSRKSFNQSV
jgi:FHS family L-fucose permease-like MFS transporter